MSPAVALDKPDMKASIIDVSEITIVKMTDLWSQGSMGFSARASRHNSNHQVSSF